MNTYAAFLDGQKIQVDAPTKYEAKLYAGRIFQAREKNIHAYKIEVILTAKNGRPVKQTTANA